MKPVLFPEGTQFGWLTVIQASPIRTKTQRMQFVCRCECGTELTVIGSNLSRGNTRSCGCKKSQLIQNFNLTHGEARIGRVSAEYKAFQKAKSRCQNPKDTSYERYGKRGIEFRFTSFDEFLKELGRRPSKTHSVDRRNNSGHYEPDNVRWATAKEQANNRRPRRKKIDLAEVVAV